MSEVGRPKTTGRLLSFDTDCTGRIEVVDHIERRRCRINTQNDTEPEAIPAGKFHFPVDQGIAITTTELSLPYSAAVSIRNDTGLMIDQLKSGDDRSFPCSEYNIEFSTPIKLYLVIDVEFRIKITPNRVTIEFESSTEVYIGARSHHEHPAGEITTPPDPEKIMKAVSHLSSALKTTTCERSYPTLRGHPPEITLGDRLKIPQILTKPETGVKIETPPNIRSVCVISPLAYYFGADIIPGESHVIRTPQGFQHSLDNTEREFEGEVKRVLKQCFFLDCLTRTEGYYQVTLSEREHLNEKLNLDFATLYDETLPEQLERYLSISYNTIESYIPKWKQTVYMEAAPDNVEFLPFLINDLAAIHSAENADFSRHRVNDSIGEDGTIVNRSTNNSTVGDDQDGLIRKNSKSRSGDGPKPEEYIEIPECDSNEQTWVGDGIPIGASKSMISAFKNRLKRKPVRSDIEISVIVNDSQMMREGKVVDEVYATRKELGLNANVYNQLSTDELYKILQKDTDFLHYIGHIDKDGFECVNGKLDLRELENTGVDSFFLNACSSYRQAIELINTGSIAGIATVKPVLNSGAERVGKTVARLLNRGFPLIAALNIAKSESIMGNNYVVIGDGGLGLTQEIGGTPSSCKISRNEDMFSVKYKTHLTRRKNIGSITIPHVEGVQEFYLTSGYTGEFILNIDDLLRFLSTENMPVKIDSKLYWSAEITTEQLVSDF